jgi:hypothetical protein
MDALVLWAPRAERSVWLSCAMGVFLFKDDMRQHRLGDVGAGLCVVDEKGLAPLHHCRELIERHKGEGASIIEAPVRVFLDDDGAVRIGHRLTPGNPAALPRGLVRSNLSH